jgi:hypothetical protein
VDLINFNESAQLDSTLENIFGYPTIIPSREKLSGKKRFSHLREEIPPQKNSPFRLKSIIIIYPNQHFVTDIEFLYQHMLLFGEIVAKQKTGET